MGGWTILGVPLYTLADYSGMGGAPSALRKAGIGRAVGPTDDTGDVKIPPLKKDSLEGQVKNLTYFREATSKVYAAGRSITAERTMVLGGECSETVGVMAGLAARIGRRAGMLWLDAHGDFNTPSTSPSGYIGGMCLAMACGRPSDLNLGTGGTPPLGEERLVHVGSRALDPPEVEAFNSSPARLFTAQQVRNMGATNVAEEAARHLDNRSDWIAVHLDVDVVDSSLISAVNYPTPGGLTIEEAATVIRSAMKTGKVRVLEVAAYNASKDRKNASSKAVVTLVKSALA